MKLKRSRKALMEGATLIVPVLLFVIWGLASKKAGQLGHLEGFYRVPISGQKSFNYLRLYKHDSVTMTSTRNIPSQINAWFHRDHPFIEKGQYYLDGNRIQFSVSHGKGNIDFEGTFDSTSIRFHSYSHITGHETGGKYKILP